MSIEYGEWGWDSTRDDEFSPWKDRGCRPGRIITPGRGIHRLVMIAESGPVDEFDARLTGRARNDGMFPAAGDWVACREEGGTVLIDGVLERRTVISRKTAGDVAEEQILGVNVDVLFVVQALGSGRSFHPRGLERYLAMAWESGCRPVVVLNKSDLSEDPEDDRLRAEAAAPGVDILTVSTFTGAGMDEFGVHVSPGETAAFVGPSGVGKSSLINALAGTLLADTGAVREDDKRGRHTTTRRELLHLDDGRLLLDTPGLRELQLWGEEESVDSAFPEIDELTRECRFRDCRHETEPGCAVREGLADGRIDPDRFDSWLELRRELAWLATRRDEKARNDYQQKWMKIAKDARMIKKGKQVW